DPRAARITEAAARMARRSGGAADKQPVRIGIGAPWKKNVAEAALAAADWVTRYLGGFFGCGQLVGMVHKSFPRDTPSDPPDPALALISARVAPPPLRGGMEEAQSQRSEFLRRLFTWPLREAFAAVRVEPLCEWLRQEFAAFDWQWARARLEQDFLET